MGNAPPEPVRKKGATNKSVLQSSLGYEAYGRGVVWPKETEGSVVPYSLDKGFDKPEWSSVKSLINKAINIFNRKYGALTSVTWREVDEKDSHEYSVLFMPSNERCASFVGCQRQSKQVIEIANWDHLLVGNILHEMLHCMGLEHEHSRIDRNFFVSIHPSLSSNFNFARKALPLGEYDHKSIMHYPACRESDGQFSIQALDPTKQGVMGNREDLSDGDVRALAFLYNPRCTFESLSQGYFPQIWFECKDCWGEKSNYGCCVVCAKQCHKDHNLVLHEEEESGTTFVCDCGRNGHKKKVCTYYSTGPKDVLQDTYHCDSCFPDDPSSLCCYQCKNECHKNHKVVFSANEAAHCDCKKRGCRIERPK